MPKFIACATPPTKFLRLSRVPAEIVNFVSQPNIFQHNVSAHGNQIKKYTPESFFECTGASNVVKVGKSSPGSWTRAEETTFSKSSSCSWQNVNC